jgi:multisubunit Na+/H+ antiporter MnhB subunit
VRQAAITVFVVLLMGFVLFIANGHREILPNEVSAYYLHNFTSDTGAGNAVAAIYLNYRMYDTLFEALILLTSIIGMLHFFKAGGNK